MPSFSSYNLLGATIEAGEVSDGAITFAKLNANAKPATSMPEVYILYDTWADDLLSSRTATYTQGDLIKEISNNGTTYYITLSATSSTLCPTWTQEAGAASVASGTVTLATATTDKISTPYTGTEATYELVVQWATYTGAGADFFFRPQYQDGNNNIYIKMDGNGNPYQLVKYVAGVATIIVNSTWGQDTNEHTIKVIIDTGDDWELFLDGVSKGTGSDAWRPTTAKLYMENVSNNNIYIKELKVY
jgi:hypothetical protein